MVQFLRDNHEVTMATSAFVIAREGSSEVAANRPAAPSAERAGTMTRLYRYIPLLVLVGIVSTSFSPSAGANSRPRVHGIPWGLTGCIAVIALIPLDAAAVEPHLPEGFTPVVPDSVRALLPPDPRLESVFGLEALSCEEGVGLRGDVAGMKYGSYWTFVQPPERLADNAYPLNFFKWDTLVPDQPRRDFLDRRGLSVFDGDANFGSWNASPFGIAFDVALDLEGSGSHRFLGAAGAPVDFSGTLIEFADADRGLAAWRTAYASASAFGGSGLVELDGGSFPAEVVGAQAVQSYFLVGTGINFTDAYITLPRR